jgi:hypothetical protein
MIRQFRLDGEKQPGGTFAGKNQAAFQPTLRPAHL